MRDLRYEPMDESDEVALPSPRRDASANEPPARPGRRPAGGEVDTEMADLALSDLGDIFGNDGPIAQLLDHYELRPSQLQMANGVKLALLTHTHALIEAPTGTGKSIAYLLPAILSGRPVVVSTANKALQSQLFQKDIPFLREVLGQPIEAVVVKGRSNYICNYKYEKELREQQTIALYDKEDPQVTYLRTWLDETDSGDVDELPFVLNNDLRPRLVSFPDDCLHQECPYNDDDCWINSMRDAAANAQVVITNHHLMLNALELGFAGERILPPAAIYIIDEAHHLEQIATAVFETTVTDFTVEQLLQRSLFKEMVPDDEVEELRARNFLAFQEVSNRGRENSFKIEGDLAGMSELATALERLSVRLKAANPHAAAVERARNNGGQPDDVAATANRLYELTLETLNSTVNKLKVVAKAGKDDEMVRYAVRLFERRHVSLEIHAAPINTADLLSKHLFHPLRDGEEMDRTVICTSATLATNGHFEHFKQRCGIATPPHELVLPTVFNYPQQAVLYQPPLPAFDFRNADAFYDAVAGEVERLLEVSRGRALVLFSSWGGLQQVYGRLMEGERRVIWPVKAQGGAPRDALLQWFRATPYSVLLATRSFWEGVDIPGDDLSLVILDKMPFPTPGDPLHGARMQAVEQEGKSSFADYMVPLMTLALKQGFGRLVRRASDRGVVAILDERLSSKSYGRQTRADLPPARFTREFRDVHRFYQEALATPAEFALNVFAATAGSGVRWEWQLLRLQDGKADSGAGRLNRADDVTDGEVDAAVAALAELRERVERAGRKVDQYAVEVRWSAAAATRIAAQAADDGGFQAWLKATAPWRAVTQLIVEPVAE